jgi:DNA-binding MarR family transcriptional regulator
MKDPLRSLPGYALRRASNAMLQDFGQRLAPLNLKPTEASIILLIKENSNITQSDIGRMLDIQRANMTPITARLEERGIVLRERVDGRSQALRLSPAGIALAVKVQSAVIAHEDQLLARVKPALRDSFLSALSDLWER